MKCAECGEEITNVYATRSVELEKDGDTWIEKNIFSSGCSCPNCHEDISVEDADEMGLPIEYR